MNIKQKIKIKFCPKCKSTEIIPLAGGIMGNFKCLRCGFTSSIFPEKEVEIKEKKNERRK